MWTWRRAAESVARVAGTLTVAVICLLPARIAAQPTATGGFVEPATSTSVRPLLTASQIQSLLPARGAFVFPAPYLTQAVRITNATDCGGNDCVNYVGYSYWRNTNNHAGGATMYIFVTLDRARGGGGPTLFSLDKATQTLAKVGPLFGASSALSWATGEGWYFSGTRPTALYLNEGPALERYDVVSKAFETVFDVSTQPGIFGTNRMIWQLHSSSDDKVHSSTLRDATTYADLGCFAYQEDIKRFSYYPIRSTSSSYDECQIDKSGRWLLIKENVDGLNGEDNRIIDLSSGTETTLLDQNGAAGHSDSGHGYMVAADNYDSHPNAIKLWKFGQNPLTGRLVYHSMDWNVSAPNHASHANAKPVVAAEQQYVCGSGANRTNTNRANEILCFPLDGSLRVLVVAPVMTDLDAAGGRDDYSKLPKGNVDVTGQYFIWTSNMRGNRLDAFLVRVPSQLLAGAPPGAPTNLRIVRP